MSLFCRPLGSPTPPALLHGASGPSSPASSGDRLSNADSGECSSDSEFNAANEEDDDDDEGEDEVVKVTKGGDDFDKEPVFDAACLDTQLERTFDCGEFGWIRLSC